MIVNNASHNMCQLVTLSWCHSYFMLVNAICELIIQFIGCREVAVFRECPPYTCEINPSLGTRKITDNVLFSRNIIPPFPRFYDLSLQFSILVL